MGIPSQVARVILREHRFRPITGRLLSIGKQTVQLTPRQAISLVEAELGTRLDVDPSKLEIDRWTRNAENRELISDRAFYSLFCDAQYHCLDQSDYENADIVFDLCNAADLSPALENGFDFVFDGSVLDNVFDPATALRNMARMARVGGRVLHVDRASRRHNVYVAFALSWFHDFYSINEFDDCQVHLAQWDDSPLTSRWDFYYYRPLRMVDGAFKFFGQDTWYQPWRHAHAIVIAEKGSQSTWQKSPTQFEYRANVRDRFVDSKFEAVPLDPAAIDQDPYSRAAARFGRTRRPPLLRPEEKVELPPELYNYAPEIVYCGSLEALS